MRIPKKVEDTKEFQDFVKKYKKYTGNTTASTNWLVRKFLGKRW